MKKYLPLLLLLGFSLSAIAGWEDTGAPVKRQTQGRSVTRPATSSYSQPSSVRKTVAQPTSKKRVSGADVARQAPRTTFAPMDKDLYWTFIDSHKPTDRFYSLFYFAPSEVIPDHSVSSAEFEASFLLADFYNVLGGDVNFRLNTSITSFLDDGDMDVFPSLLTELSVDVQWLWRFLNHWAMEIGATPGVYADIKGYGVNALSVPFRGCFYLALNPEISFRVGAEFRPTFDRAVIPLAGLSWQPSEQFILELGVPRSLLLFKLGTISLYGKAEWENMTYAMEDSPTVPEDLTIEDWKIGGGLLIDVNKASDFKVGLEGGMLLNRTFKAEGEIGRGSLSADNSIYFGITIGSKF